MTKENKVKIAAIGDIHVRETSQNEYQELFQEISKNADVLGLCGDLTNLGLVKEAEVLAQELSHCTIPVVAVLGNHDYESGKENKIREVLINAGVSMLDVESKTIDNVGFAGVKGYIGGFDTNMLGAFGEKGIKNIVSDTLNEVLHLENSLSQLQTDRKVVLMHYSPVKDTLEGEPLEIYTYLGSSRLSEPIDNYKASAVFHGHAHFGSPEGKTLTGIPVYNVSLPVLRKENPKKPYRIIEI
jgi:Icc-related predicted phosphoesterase